MSHRSISIAKSSLHPSVNKINQTKSEYADQNSLAPHNFSQWYIKKSQRINTHIPKGLQAHQRSQPFRLVISKVTGMASKAVKNSKIVDKFLIALSSGVCAINIQRFIGVRKYSIPIIEGKHQFPICFYYHSCIDRNSPDLKMLLNFQILSLKDGIVQNISDLGSGVLDRPLVDQSAKTNPIYKQNPSFDLLFDSSKLSPTSSSFSYEIQSSFELKNLTKMVPANQIFSSENEITGILDSFLLNDPNQNIYEEDSCIVNIKVLQIHIPQKYQTALLEQLKKLRISEGEMKFLKRKIMCGYHNEYHFVSPVERKLDFLEKQATGEMNINIYEAVSEDEVLKVPYYVVAKESQFNCTLGISLIYEISGIDYQIQTCIFCLTPNLSGVEIEISEKMITGGGLGLTSQLFDCKNEKVPTIVIEYKTEESATQHNLDISEDTRLKTSHRIPLKTSKRIITQQQIRMESKMMEEIEKQRLLLEREKEELERLKTNQYITYHEDFEKRLEAEREQLWKKQKILQEQYREEVEKQIRRKNQLEKQIRDMKDRLLAIEEGTGRMTKKPSYDISPQPEENQYLRYQNNDSFATGVFNFSVQKVNPAYLMDQQKIIPVTQVRDALLGNFEKSKELIAKQYTMFNYASKFTFNLSTVLWSDQLEAPKSFFIYIRFFNFSQFKTDTISYIESGSQHHQLIKLNHYTYGYEDITPVYTFTVDPSEFSNPELIQQDLTNYLCKNNAIFDIFDAQNHIYIGQINIKLSNLLRGNKSQTLVAKEFNIVRVKSQENYGVMQILMKNQQVECKNPVSIAHKRRQRQIKKKVISNTPIVLTKEQNIMNKSTQQLTLVNKQTTRNRQQERILNYKKKVEAAKQKGVVKFEGLSDQEKGHLINKIQQYKEKKMPQFISNIYERILNDHITINPHLGQSKTFHYEFTNISDSPGSFRISISGSQSDEQELKVIKNTAQWKHYVSKHGFPQPKLYECINDQNCFYLSSGESIPLLFKYLSFNDHQSGDKIQSRSLSVSIIKEENNWIVGGFSLNVEPHQSIINHSFILYQPGGHLTDLILPVLYSSSDARIPKHLYVTSESSEAEWINQYEILLRTQTPEIMNKVKFNLFLYEDEYFDRLQENWLIEIHAYEGVCTYSRPQEKTKFKICLPADIEVSNSCKKLKLNSSHPDLVFQEAIISGARLQRAGPIDLWCELLANSLATQIQITCTDPFNNLVYGWIVQIFPYIPRRN